MTHIQSIPPDALPALLLADAYYRVSGLQYVPDRRGLYLVASADGLTGIYLVGVRVKVEAA